MWHLLRPAAVVTAAVTLAAAGGVAAYAGWQIPGRPQQFTVYAASVPRMPAPRVRLRAVPRISWAAVELAPGLAVQRYVVTRHVGRTAQVVCDVPAVGMRRCVDVAAPAGYLIGYTVAAGCGLYWRGEESEPSAAVIVPGGAEPAMGGAVSPGAVSPGVVSPGPSGAVSVAPLVSEGVERVESVPVSPSVGGDGSAGGAVLPSATVGPQPSPTVPPGPAAPGSS
jgi:hypothetical protein